MTGCPFGFHAAAEPELSDVDDACDSPGKRAACASGGNAAGKAPGACPFSHAAGAARDDADRFDYQKDPVAWFYQNQIRCEEDFQAKKVELRAAAIERLENIFEKRGKHLVVDSDDDFSIATSELSAWDSEVHSMRTLASCADSWAAAHDFGAPALATLRGLLLLTLAAACYSAWRSLQALRHVNRFWGIVRHGWLPTASLGAAVLLVLLAAAAWYAVDARSRPGLLGAQVAMQVACAGCTALALLARVFPSQVDDKFARQMCAESGPVGESVSRLCSYLPVVQEQVALALAAIGLANGGLALLALGVAAAGSWHFWELGFVEKKALKHRRRRKRSKRSIPWDKIKVEDIGPVSFCGGGPPVSRAAAAAASKQPAEGKKTV